MRLKINWASLYLEGNLWQQFAASFTETRLEDVDLSKPPPCKYYVYNLGNPSQDWRVNYSNSTEYTVTLFDCSHLAHVIVLWQMQKFMC